MRFTRNDTPTLPVYPRRKVLCTSRDFRNAAEAELPSFVRRITINGDSSFESLTELLEAREAQIQQIATVVGAYALKPAWGVAKLRRADRSTTSPNVLPAHRLVRPGYGLVAQVATVPEAYDIGETPHLATALARRTGVYESQQNPGDWFDTDLTWYQYVHGAVDQMDPQSLIAPEGDIVFPDCVYVDMDIKTGTKQ